MLTAYLDVFLDVRMPGLTGPEVAQADDLLRRLQALLPKPAEYLRWVRASVGNDVRLVATDEIC